MKYCQKCGAEIYDEAVICPKCGCQQPTAKPVPANEEGEKYTGLIILSVLIPLAGLIIFCVNNNTYPVKAKNCGLAALISFAVGMFIYLIAYFALIF